MYRQWCFFICLFALNAQEVPYVPFDQAMNIMAHRLVIKKPIFTYFYYCFRQLYTRNNPSMVTPCQLRRIPKIIHQIWLGSEVPEVYKKFIESWKVHHPGWEYRLWTDKDVDTFPFINKDIFNRVTNYGEKSDIWRYEILLQYGGVYIDVDFECIKPLDPLHYMYDLYVGIQPMDTKGVQLGIGIIGACPRHPLLQKAVAEIPLQRKHKQIVLRTGPIFFSTLFARYGGTFSHIDVALPPPYFYPRGYHQGIDEFVVGRESFAVHHWAGSWLK